MQSMYAKLFSRIAQSSLMEQDVETRYCFMMLLAIADVQGDVIGTDVAIARTVNLPLESFRRSITALMSPDPDSNSPAHEGRRVIPSENGRGYRLVNYTTYRTIKTAEEKRAYMREYMRERRKSERPVKNSNLGKDVLDDVTHAEAESEEDINAESLSSEAPPPPKVTIRKRKPKEESLADPRHTEFRTIFEEEYQIANGHPYAGNRAADGKQLQCLLKALPDLTPTSWREGIKWCREISGSNAFADACVKKTGKLFAFCAAWPEIVNYSNSYYAPTTRR